MRTYRIKFPTIKKSLEVSEVPEDAPEDTSLEVWLAGLITCHTSAVCLPSRLRALPVGKATRVGRITITRLAGVLAVVLACLAGTAAPEPASAADYARPSDYGRYVLPGRIATLPARAYSDVHCEDIYGRPYVQRRLSWYLRNGRKVASFRRAPRPHFRSFAHWRPIVCSAWIDAPAHTATTLVPGVPASPPSD